MLWIGGMDTDINAPLLDGPIDASWASAARSNLQGLLEDSVVSMDLVSIPQPYRADRMILARMILGETISITAGIQQWGNAAGLVVAFFEEDWVQMTRCVGDSVTEPARATVVPGFQRVMARALEAGAVAAGLSGSGPSVFALCRGWMVAERDAAAMAAASWEEPGLASDAVASPVDGVGARIREIASSPP